MTEQQQTLAQLRKSLARIEAGTDPASVESAPSAEPGPADDPPGGETPTDEEAYAKARAVVLRKLTGSAKSRHQLAQALREREFAEGVIDQVLDRMEEVQLIDDAAFARTWVRNRHELKGLGAAALRRELIDRGVEAEHIQAALEQLSAEDEDAAAQELIDNKLRGVVIPVGQAEQDRKEREKIARRLVGMLGRRGHNPSAAMRLVRDAMSARTS